MSVKEQILSNIMAAILGITFFIFLIVYPYQGEYGEFFGKLLVFEVLALIPIGIIISIYNKISEFISKKRNK